MTEISTSFCDYPTNRPNKGARIECCHFPSHLPRFDDLISPASFSAVLEFETDRVRWPADTDIPTGRNAILTGRIHLQSPWSFWSEDIYGTCDSGGARGGFMPFFVPHLWSPFGEMGWGGRRVREAGTGRGRRGYQLGGIKENC